MGVTVKVMNSTSRAVAGEAAAARPSQGHPELIDAAQRLLSAMTGRPVSEADARESVETLRGFFMLLAEWKRPANRS
jgi:hypothetical protein